MLKNQILILENKIRFVNSIRDRYFDKKGYLNPNKERVKQIFKIYSQTKEPKHFIYKKPKTAKKNLVPKRRK